jgi:putative inorganic carbon (hco3(-)) transporter
MVLTEKRKRGLIVGISLLFILVQTIMITMEVYWMPLLPAVLILLALYFLSMDKIFLFVALLTPLSFDIPFKEFGMNLTIPTEPLLMGMLILLLLKFLHQNPFNRQMWVHPVSVLIILQLLWMLMTTITSELPGVSLKYFVMRLWFVIPVYFFGILVFKNERNIRTFLILFLSSLAAVVIYTTWQHAILGFDGSAAHWVMWPFFNDHTAYGAILAMLLPVGIAFMLDHHYSRSLRLVFGVLTAIILMGVVLSVSRAAWVSVMAALGFFLVLRFRIKFKVLALSSLVLLGLLFAFQDRIITRLEQNTQESEETDLAKHAQSISNISTDASNMERLNRWSAAFRMFRERPLVGWGPGTYQFVYAPFQHSAELTIISTNSGDLGNVHSEYIGPLCDSGLPGGLLMLLLVIMVIAVTLRLLHARIDQRLRWYLMAVFLGLTTYYVHGFLNNFLDTDKASVPFWGFTAIIVAIDLFHTRAEKGVASEGANQEGDPKASL